jgi:DNA-binding LacI/PurR family transcriptional regulator
MQDVAKACGVSKNTVSQALRNSPQVSEATRKRIAESVKSLGYKKNAVVAELMARLLAGGTRRFQCTLALINANRPKHPSRVEQILDQVLGWRLQRRRAQGVAEWAQPWKNGVALQRHLG